MGQRKPILPPEYATEPEPIPLTALEIDKLARWIAGLNDKYLLAYCLYWGLGADLHYLQEYIGGEEVVRKIRAFPNLCRRYLRKETNTVIGFDDLHRVFERLLKGQIEILLLTPSGASCVPRSNHIAYLTSIGKLQEQRQQQEIIHLNKHPTLLADQYSLPAEADINREAITAAILELPEEYERITWMYFVEQKSVEAIARKLGIQRVRGIIEYCRRMISQRLGYAAPLDDSSITRILREL